MKEIRSSLDNVIAHEKKNAKLKEKNFIYDLIKYVQLRKTAPPILTQIKSRKYFLFFFQVFKDART